MRKFRRLVLARGFVWCVKLEFYTGWNWLKVLADLFDKTYWHYLRKEVSK